MNRAPRVLLVDGPRETRDVLEAIFEPRGVAVDRVRSDAGDLRRIDSAPSTDVDANAEDSPRVVVLHEDSPAETAWADVPRIVIGRAHLGAVGSQSLPQPFEYGELVRAIESVLDTPGE